MYEGIWHVADEEVVDVLTQPRDQSRTFRYPFRECGDGVVVLARERDWYTRHSLRYADEELDEEVMRRHVAPSQRQLDEYVG